MPKVELSRQHSLSLEQARKKLQDLAMELSEKYGIKSDWKGENILGFKGKGADGIVRLTEGQIAVQVNLSMLLTPLKGKVEDRLKTQLEREFP